MSLKIADKTRSFVCRQRPFVAFAVLLLLQRAMFAAPERPLDPVAAKMQPSRTVTLAIKRVNDESVEFVEFEDRFESNIHAGGHVFEIESIFRFFDEQLR